MSVKLNVPSLLKLAPDANQMMIYGFAETNYEAIEKCLSENHTRDKTTNLKKVFDWKIGSNAPKGCGERTLEGRIVNSLPTDSNSIARTCKNGIANLLLENYKRECEGKPLIPLVYCLQIDDEENSHTFSPQDMTTRETGPNGRISHKELRRMYKLCTDPSVDPKLREVAKKSLLFVNVKKQEDGALAFEKTAAPWETEGFEKLWATRKGTKPSLQRPAKIEWRKELDKAIQEYIQSKALPVKNPTHCVIL